MLCSSQRVALRRLAPDDFEVFWAYRSDPEVARFQSWPKLDRAQTLGFLTAMHTVDPVFRPGQWTQIAVAEPRSNRLLGDMGLFLSEDRVSAELGITLARDHWHLGIATEALALAIEFVFGETEVESIICGADSRNTRSLALIERAGFVWTHQEPGMTGATDEMFQLRRSTEFTPN